MDDDTQFCAAVASAIAAKLAVERPPWLRTFEEVADELARQGDPPKDAFRKFEIGLRRCREIVEGLGFSDPSTERVLIVAVFAAQGLAFARSLGERPGATRSGGTGGPPPGGPRTRERRASSRRTVRNDDLRRNSSTAAMASPRITLASFSRPTESVAPRHLGALQVPGFCFPGFPRGAPPRKAARHAEERRVGRACRTSRRLTQGERP